MELTALDWPVMAKYGVVAFVALLVLARIIVRG